MLVAFFPTDVDGQCDILLGSEESCDEIRREEDIRITADELLIHEILRVHEREEDVIVLPVCVVPEGEIGIIRTDLVDLVAADEANIVNSVVGQRAE